MTATYRVDNDVAIISMDNPPVNGLSLSVRQGVVEGLMKASADPAVSAIVLQGNARGFSGGADIREFGTPDAVTEPNLWTVIENLEKSGKPVVAAIHSVCMGGGLELALGCNYRVVAPDCAMAFPEINLGLLPGAGGTQRMPRAIGVENALNMILDGKSVKSQTLAAIPEQALIDVVAESKESLEAEALAFARTVAKRVAPGGHPLLRDRQCSHEKGAGYFQFVRNMLPASVQKLPAPKACIEAVEASTTTPIDKGLARERELFMHLVESPEGRALRHAFLAERAASKIPGVPDGTATRDIRSVAVIGGGTMGRGIAICLLDAGLPVTLLETAAAQVERAVESLRSHYDGQLKKKRIDAASIEKRLGALKTTLDYKDLAECDLVIEAVFEEMSVKQAVFEKLDEVMHKGAILASNTSTMNLDQIAGFTKRPEDVVGMHFFSPANVMRLLEVVRGAETSAEVLATVMAFSRRIRKAAVVSGVCDGFIGNRMVEEYIRQAYFLVEEGATPQQVDRALVEFGMAMGPFAMSDMAGNDIGFAIRQRRAVERPELVYSKFPDLLYEAGRYGQKVDAGWYDYVPGKRAPVASPAVEKMLKEHREKHGITPRKVTNQEIVDRLILALVNEGAKILEEGIASRSGDIDVVYLTGYGFPAWRGGPMQYANERGLYQVAQTMKALQNSVRVDREFWTPSPLIERLIGERRQLV